MNLLLANILFCFLMPAPVIESNVVFHNETVLRANEDDKKEEERADTTLENTLLGTGVGLVAVGGIGAGVIAHNNNKPKDTPSKTISGTYYDDDDENKKRLKNK